MAETIAGSGADGSESTTVYSSARVVADHTVDVSKTSSNVVTAAQFALSVAEEDVKTEEYVLFLLPPYCFTPTRLSLRQKVQVQDFDFAVVHSIGFLI